MLDKFAKGYACDTASHNHTGNNGAGKFKDVTEPEVDCCFMLLSDVYFFAGFFYNWSRKACTA